MKIIASAQKMQQTAAEWRKENLRIALVPTMGALHEGHLSLLKAAAEECDKVVMSIFVNPKQFGPGEDYAAYPRNFALDSRLAHAAGADAIFIPTPKEMYPPGYDCYLYPQSLGVKLCGKSRPGHFQGVCTVVMKLFQITQPHLAYFGQKDAQQFIILRQMAEDFNLPLKLRRMPIIREPDGLAKSSRNLYLSPEERQEAPILYRALQEGKNLYEAGERSPQKIREALLSIIEKAPLAHLDYLEIVHSRTLEPLSVVEKPFLIAAAVYFGKTRLIDNLLME